ncbi:MAG: DUF1707 domain-containing protein [Actinomycetota bacterium]|nr:DUF1707 domain-containing protein [Actinomycetota bacterium]
MTDGLVQRAGIAELRIGTAEREQAAAMLGEHFSAGRLDTDEFDDRVRSAYQARTTSELAALFGDLPGNRPGVPVEASRVSRPGRAYRSGPSWPGRRLPLFLLLAVAVAGWVALVHLPPFFLFPLLWFAFGRSRRRRYRMAGHFQHR